MTFTDVITRPGDPAPLVPQPVVAQVIEELPAQSALLSLARQVPMSARTNRLPVLDVLPKAYFVNGDTGLKQTSDQDWKNVILTAEELAVIVPIPQAYLDDADVPIWDEVRPRISEAFGAAIDAAGLFGVNKPATWSTDIFTLATTTPLAGQASGGDLGTDFADIALALAEDGYAANGFAVQPGFVWRLVGFRNAQGFPIYQPDPRAGIAGAGMLYGYPLKEVNSGGWDSTKASAVVGDWTKAIVGMRQDMTFQLFTEGVISDAAGNVVLNLMQQDAVALRCVMRLGFQTANPVTQLNQAKADAARQAFRVLLP